MREEVIRPCGLPHHGLRTPTLSNTHRFLCWPANGGSTLRSLSDPLVSWLALAAPPLAEGQDEGPCASIYQPSWGSLGSCNCTAAARPQ